MRKWSFARLSDIMPKKGIISLQFGSAHAYKQLLYAAVRSLHFVSLHSHLLAFVPSCSSVSILVLVAQYPDLPWSPLDGSPVSVRGGGMCLCEKPSEKAIK